MIIEGMRRIKDIQRCAVLEYIYIYISEGLKSGFHEYEINFKSGLFEIKQKLPTNAFLGCIRNTETLG